MRAGLGDVLGRGVLVAQAVMRAMVLQKAERMAIGYLSKEEIQCSVGKIPVVILLIYLRVAFYIDTFAVRKPRYSNVSLNP